MTSTARDELSSYLENWDDPLTPSDLASALGLSLATVRVYKSRMDLDPSSNKNLLPKTLPKRGKKVLYTKSLIIDWWLEPSSTEKVRRGRPTVAERMARGANNG